MSTIRYQTETVVCVKAEMCIYFGGGLVETSRAIGNWPVNSVSRKEQAASLQVRISRRGRQLAIWLVVTTNVVVVHTFGERHQLQSHIRFGTVLTLAVARRLREARCNLHPRKIMRTRTRDATISNPASATRPPCCSVRCSSHMVDGTVRISKSQEL